MGTFIVVVVNVIFILFVYFVFSRRVGTLEQKRLPEETRNEIDGLLTDFNQIADTNVNLLEDRISRLQPLIKQANAQIEKLNGLIVRVQTLQKDLRKPAEEILASSGATRGAVKQQPAADVSEKNAVLNKRRAFESYAAESGANNSVKKAVRKRSPARRRKRVDKSGERIRKLAESGATAEEISQKLGLSVQQVEMRLAFGRYRGGDTG